MACKCAKLISKICITMQISEGEYLLVKLCLRKTNRKSVNLIRRQDYHWKGKFTMYIELKSIINNWLRYIMFNLQNWKNLHKQSQLFRYYTYKTGRTHFGKLMPRGIWGRYRILKIPGFLADFLAEILNLQFFAIHCTFCDSVFMP